MILLILGILMWWATHMSKYVVPAQLSNTIKRLKMPLLIVSLLLIVFGFRASPFIHIWGPLGVLFHVNNLMMLCALYFVSPGPKKGALFYKMRHPMMIGISIWATAHLLVNGDLASILLFGSMLIWAITTMSVTNKFEPDWEPNPRGTVLKDIMYFGVAVLLLGGIGAIHGLVGPSPFLH